MNRDWKNVCGAGCVRVHTDGRALEIPVGEALEGVRGGACSVGKGLAFGSPGPFSIMAGGEAGNRRGPS